MATFTVAECDANIAVLKQKLTDALGSAERETFYEGQTKYEYENLVKSIRNDISYFELQKQIALAETNGTSNPYSYIPRKEFGI